VRKFFGILLIITGWLIALMSFLAALSNIIKAIKRNSESTYLISYSIGTLIGLALFASLAYWLVKKGLQLTRKKEVNDLQEKMESIR
jgi:hypothetical protein